MCAPSWTVHSSVHTTSRISEPTPVSSPCCPPNHLAVSPCCPLLLVVLQISWQADSKCPVKRCLAPKNFLQAHQVIMLVQKGVKLAGCHLIVSTHLLVNYRYALLWPLFLMAFHFQVTKRYFLSLYSASGNLLCLLCSWSFPRCVRYWQLPVACVLDNEGRVFAASCSRCIPSLWFILSTATRITQTIGPWHNHLLFIQRPWPLHMTLCCNARPEPQELRWSGCYEGCYL